MPVGTFGFEGVFCDDEFERLGWGFGGRFRSVCDLIGVFGDWLFCGRLGSVGWRDLDGGFLRIGRGFGGGLFYGRLVWGGFGLGGATKSLVAIRSVAFCAGLARTEMGVECGGLAGHKRGESKQNDATEQTETNGHDENLEK